MNDEEAVGFVVKCTSVDLADTDDTVNVGFVGPWKNDEGGAIRGHYGDGFNGASISLYAQPMGRWQVGRVYMFRTELEGVKQL